MTCTRVLLWGVLLAVLATPALAAQAGPNCAAWNTQEYFQTATVEDVTACLAAGADVAARTDDGHTPLHLAAAANDNPAVLEALLATGAELEARSGTGQTLLHLAAMYNENPAVIEALVAAGADPMARTDDGHTPLHNAAWFNENPAVIEALLAAGADPNAHLRFGDTPLHVAADRHGTAEVIRALLSAGANTEARDEDGNMPLHTAAKYVHWAFPDNLERIGDDDPHAGDAIEALLAAGADPTARNAAGQTPWDLAQENEALRGSDAYWRLNDARFNAPGPGARRAPTTVPGGGTVGDPAGNTGAVASGGQCLIPNYPSPPGGVANLGFSWCPASVDIQRRSFALQAAGAQCAIATGSSSTPEQIQARRQEINAACNILDAWQSPDIPTCQCPAGLRR